MISQYCLDIITSMNRFKLKPIDYTSATVAKELHDITKDTGFVIFKNHPIDKQLIADVFADWKHFFSIPSKHNYTRVAGQRFGYFPPDISETPLGHDVKDIKEFFHYNLSNTLPSELSDKSKQLFKAMEKLSEQLLVWLEGELPEHIKSKLSEPLSSMIKGSVNLMRIAHYPPVKGDETKGAMRAAPHIDINFLTILLASSEPGLQVQDNDGNWHDVPIDKDIISINIGALLQEATKGYYPATMHRVVTSSKQEELSRYSIPFFLQARLDARLSERYTAEEHLMEHLKILDKGAY